MSKWTHVSEFDGRQHASMVAGGVSAEDQYVTACGQNLSAGTLITQYGEGLGRVNCPDCLFALAQEHEAEHAGHAASECLTFRNMSEQNTAPGLGINQLVDLITEINTANGWRENTGAVLTEETAEAQIAGTSDMSGCVAGLIEAIRKPTVISISEQFDGLHKTTDLAHHLGIEDHTDFYLTYVTREKGQPVHGSKTQAIARARLFDTESAELTDAILNDDLPNMAEELADVLIRVLDFVGAWNEAHPDRPIDLQAATMAKLEKNRTRGYRHGGKRA